MKDYLYFDHAAATTLRPEAQAAMENALQSGLGNPSSVHQVGRRAKGLLDEARINLAAHFLVKPAEVVFTSGATEAVHTGLIGAYLGLKDKRGVIYTSPLVHSCVWAALDFLQTQHQVEVKLLPLAKTGHLELEKITETIVGESDIIVIEHLNSEIGVLQPAAKIGKKIIRLAEETEKTKPLFMVDAAASVVSERVGLDFQKCDLLALSAEKVGGLSGSGVLLKKDGLILAPLLGGSQEWGWRGGTENLIGILALEAAYSANAAQQEAQNKKFIEIQKFLMNFFKTQFPDIKIITPQEGSGLHILHLLWPESPANLVIAQADLAGIALSAGSACSSGSIEGSKVLTALGYSEDEALQGVRISWGWDTTLPEAEALCDRLRGLLK